jgi:hypothetical protein
MADGIRFKARPTTFNGVQMRSRLEARYAEWLHSYGLDWEYEPRCFASSGGQYLPDFLIRDVWFLSDKRDVYVEVKPVMPTEDIFERMSVIWASEPDALLALESVDEQYVWVRTPPALSTNRWRFEWGWHLDGSLALSPPYVPRSWRTYD